jgi:hypothetical protein
VTGRLLREAVDLAATAETAAKQLGDVDAEMLVKDYWVTEALRVIQERYSGEFVFKGGTSLTKALRCVDRFSEDVDLLIVGGESRGQREKLLKGIRDEVAEVLQLEVVRQSGTTGIRRDVTLRFPSRLATRWDPTVRLEMGVRGDDDPPHQARSIEPMLADVFNRMGQDPKVYPDLAAFEVPVLHPARTLWEKVVLTHTQVTNGKFLELESTRVGRHYGDIGALLALDEVGAGLESGDVRSRIDASVRAISRDSFGVEPPPVPTGGYAASPAFQPDTELRPVLEARYDQAVQVLWSPEGRLTFEEVLARVQAASSLLDPTAA